MFRSVSVLSPRCFFSQSHGPQHPAAITHQSSLGPLWPRGLVAGRVGLGVGGVAAKVGRDHRPGNPARTVGVSAPENAVKTGLGVQVDP